MTMPEESTPPLTYQDTVQSLARELALRVPNSPGQRYMLGVTGGPGAGKSTFADSLCRELDTLLGPGNALVVPMDGFHKTNRELHALGMWERKGEAETFDASGFVALLSRIRHFPDQASAAPRFDRATDEPIPGALHIRPAHRLIIVEGNYLLLSTPPWTEIPGLLDDVWYLEAPQDIVRRRLEERHLLRGLSGDELARKITSSDLRNARQIARSKHLASRILSLPLQRD
jgi:pantothenate kinase